MKIVMEENEIRSDQLCYCGEFNWNEKITNCHDEEICQVSLLQRSEILT